MRRISIGSLLLALLIPLAVGGISAALSSEGMTTYSTMNKPPLSPPAWLFPVAWTILYLMMGLASYFIVQSETESGGRAVALFLYGLQLAMNFMWSIIFFNWGTYLFAFVWLVIMWALAMICAFKFYPISRTASYLMIPYIVWLTFAAYLNCGAYVLNMDK